MTVAVTSIDRFTKLKQKRDGLSRVLAQLQGRLEGSRERYNEIMRELQKFGIGSIDELNSKIAELDNLINVGLSEADSLLMKMEQELAAIDAKPTQ